MLRKTMGLAILLVVAALALSGRPVWAITITVDYRYDTNHFFDINPATTLNPDGATGAQQARDALAAAATRYSTLITSSLTAVNLVDDETDARIEFVHPSTGLSFEVSSAASIQSDIVVEAGGSVADEYRDGFALDADEWIFYVGARSLSAVATGGTGAGTNWNDVFDDPYSHLNRGFNTGFGSLPVWGGEAAFDNDGSTDWHFDHTTAAPSGEADFYSIALHEMGHALGLCTTWTDFTQYVVDGEFTGATAVAMLNRDNETSLTAVPLQSTTNLHWNDNSDGGSYQSYIFAVADPNLTGTVGTDTLQDLIMEPVADFVYPTIRRLELTNLDVGALEDVGWEIAHVPGDANDDGHVDATDAEILAAHWGQNGQRWEGDFNGDGLIDMADASILAANWGHGSTEAAAVPEPGAALLIVCGAIAGLIGCKRRRPEEEK